MRFSLLLALVAALFAFATTTTAQIPQPTCGGARVTIVESALNTFIQQLVPQVESYAKNISIPAITGTQDDIQYTVQNIAVNTLSIGQCTVAAVSSGPIVSIDNMNMDFTADFQFKTTFWPHISGSGTADLSSTGATAGVDINFTVNNEGLPVLAAESVSVSLNNFAVTLHGSFETKILDLLESLFQNTIKNTIQNTIEQQIASAINVNANKAISALGVVRPINDYLEIDLPLCGNPIFNSSIMSFESKAEFYYTKDPTEAPFTPLPLPVILPNNDNMVQVFVSDYTINSALYAVYASGMAEYTITPDMVPAKSPIQLNTTSFKYMIPPLYAEYPNCAMQVQASLATYPSLHFTQNGAEAQALAQILVQVIEKNGTVADAFLLDAAIDATIANLAVKEVGGNLTIVGEATGMTVNLTLKWSNVGDFSINIFQVILNGIVRGEIIPKVNELLGNGIVIPATVPGLTFVNPSLQLAEGYIAVTTDISYTLPPTPAEQGDNQDHQEDKKKDEDEDEEDDDDEEEKKKKKKDKKNKRHHRRHHHDKKEKKHHKKNNKKHHRKLVKINKH